MKKKALRILLAICLTATMVTACGTKEAEAPQETVEAANEEEPEEEAPAEPTYETVTYDVSVTSVDEESGKATAYDANGQEYILTAADTLSEDEKALLTAGANVKVSTEVEVTEDAAEETTEAEATEETEATEEVGDPGEEEAEEETTEAADTDTQGEADEQENIAPIEITVTAVEALGETEGYELNQKVQELTLGYSMEDMAETQMYAKSSVNVRKSPSADDEKLGSLSTAQEVTVTGLTSTNWYRINYNDGTAYVSANYLQNEKPVVQTAKKSSGGSASSGSSSSGSSAAQPTTADLYQVYSEAELDAAYASGDMALYNQMLTANTDAYDAKWGTHWGSASAEAPTTSGGGSSSGGSSAGSSSSEKSTSTSRELADYINQKREEEGKSSMAWSDSLASLAAQRAEEIVDDFSHNGFRGANSEIIQKTGNNSAASWYDAFYNSAGHRAAMTNDYNKSVGAAVCHSGSYYYVVVLFDIK